MNKIKVEEQYFEYTPPVRIHRSLQHLLRYVPEEYLVGLYRITLTNSENLRSVRGKITSENRRFRLADGQGLYRKGHISLIIDQIFSQYPEVFLIVPPFKTFVIGEVLYHEIVIIFIDSTSPVIAGTKKWWPMSGGISSCSCF